MLKVPGSNLPMPMHLFIFFIFYMFDTGHTPQEKAHREETGSGEAFKEGLEGKEGLERLRFN